MTTQFVPQDQDQRDRITSSLDETLFVEAGAGTGKTEALVSRIVALITTGRATISGIAAITFTELAAAELRERVRSRLLSRIEDSGSSDTEKGLCQAAIRGFDAASIQTLHSFAGQLLRERPLDIGLPPSFEVVEAIEADLNFQVRWETWLDEVLDTEDSAPALARGLALGLRLDQLKGIADSFHERYDLLERPFPTLGIPDKRAVQGIIDSRSEISSLISLAHNEDDLLAVHARKVVGFSERLESIGSDSDMALATLSRFGRLSFSRGRIADWDDDPETGKNACTALKAVLSDIEELRTNELDAVRASVICELSEKIRELAKGYAAERLHAGRLEFQDLLVLARDLLRDKEEAREYFQRRYTHILIDEFQDTDPIQAEIALLLSAESPATGDGFQDLIPGKLFVVGDPKQSIYMFRGADITVSEDLKKIIPDGQLSLTQNFRSQRPILSWLNPLFESWMKNDAEEIGQVEYRAISARWDSETDGPPMGVRFVGSALPGKATVARHVEAQAVASVVSQIKRELWPVRDGNDGGTRAAKYQDICILLPTRTGLETLEAALSSSNIPYRLESQSMVLGTQDVRDLLNCLRSIDSPGDQVALVAALRSSVFACSDVELFEFVQSDGELDYMVESKGTRPIDQALQLLRRFHDLRMWVDPEELIERFVRETRMVESCFALARPRERWRRLRFVIDRAAAFAAVSNTSLRSYLDWIERQAEEGARMVETPVPEPDEDAVRIMTIHASKGLEFPIVLLAGIGTQARTNLGPVIYDRDVHGADVSLPAPGNGRFKTPGYDDAENKEKAKGQAERTRQMYVAATRAEDHLVVSLFRPEVKGTDSSFAGSIERLVGRDSDSWVELNVDGLGSAVADDGLERKADVPAFADNLGIRDTWLTNRDESIRISSKPSSVGATRLAQLAKEEAEDGDVPYRKGRGGTNIGRAVHSALQSVDLATGDGLDEISQAQAAAEGLPGRWREVAALARTAMDSEVVKQAVSTGRYHREVYVGAPEGSVLIEGFIDLVFETEEGLIVVDYKTDGIETAEEIARSMERYRLQGGTYALGLETATGKSVTKVIFLFLHTGVEFVMDDLPGAMNEVRGAVVGLTA